MVLEFLRTYFSVIIFIGMILSAFIIIIMRKDKNVSYVIRKPGGGVIIHYSQKERESYDKTGNKMILNTVVTSTTTNANKLDSADGLYVSALKYGSKLLAENCFKNNENRFSIANVRID